MKRMLLAVAAISIVTLAVASARAQSSKPKTGPEGWSTESMTYSSLPGPASAMIVRPESASSDATTSTATRAGPLLTRGVFRPQTAEHGIVMEKLRGAGIPVVHELMRAPDGVWRGRAQLGVTEIAVAVDKSGRVSSQ